MPTRSSNFSSVEVFDLKIVGVAAVAAVAWLVPKLIEAFTTVVSIAMGTIASTGRESLHREPARATVPAILGGECSARLLSGVRE